jgi:hypothetical protein
MATTAPDRTLTGGVLTEVRWAFRRPRPWLEGLAVNLVLSIVYLAWDPLHGRHRAAWVILVGSYFATFVLADVTTTNILGTDRIRVRRGLAAGVGVFRVILAKNAVLLLLVGVPTLVATAILTVASNESPRLALTMVGVALPILTWLGVGNLVSVLLPVAYVPWRLRWRLRYRRGWTARWLVHLAIPYVLLYVLDPFDDSFLSAIRHLKIGGRERPDAHAAIVAVAAIAIWLGCTWVSSEIVRRRGLDVR